MTRYIKRGNVWQYEISTKDPITDKYKKIRKSGFSTKKAAQIAASDIELKLAKGFRVGDDNILLHQYFDNYIDIFKKDKITVRTFNKYLNTSKNLKIYFPKETLKKLTKTRYQKCLNEYAKTHADRSVRQFNTHIRAAVQNAIDEQIIATDFTKKAVVKGQGTSKSEDEKYLNFSDFTKLIKFSRDKIDPFYSTRLMIFIAGTTGMRFGELLGLKWENIDFNEKTINIKLEYNYVTKTFTDPKGYKTRKIVIDIKTAKVLEKLKIKQNELDLINPNNLVFFNPKDGIVSNNAANKVLRRMQKSLGISPTITMHGLRHTHGSVLLMHGINVLAVSKRLGHASVDITLKVYAHLLKELEDQENDKIKNELGKIL